MKILLPFIIVLIIMLYPETFAQNRRETDVLRNTDTSRRREEPVRQENHRQVDEVGKIREVPRENLPQRQPERWIDKTPTQQTQNPSPVYIEKVVIDAPDYYIDRPHPDIPIPETKIVFVSEKDKVLELLEEKQFEEAITWLTYLINKNSKDLELYFLRGIAETLAEYYDVAIEDFDYYLRFFDEDGEAYYRRALAKFLDHQKDEARKDFDLAVTFGYAKAGQFLKKYYRI